MAVPSNNPLHKTTDSSSGFTAQQYSTSGNWRWNSFGKN